MTGNTVVEAVKWLLPPPDQREEILARYGVKSRSFVLSTFHRPENVDNSEQFGSILRELVNLEYPVLLPLHPRSAARIHEFGFKDLLDQLTVIDPIGYRDFLGLSAECALLISDSGGVQEEASILKRPLIVVRKSTERPEVLGTFADLVPPGREISTTAERLLANLSEVHEYLAALPTPYGDGTAAQRSIQAIAELV